MTIRCLTQGHYWCCQQIRTQDLTMESLWSYPLRGGGGGGGTSILTVTGTCRWTGYDFAVINIGTGYLNRPNWLLAGYSVYHRVASRASQPGSQPTMFMTGPRSRHQRPPVWDATDFYECMIHSRIESPSVPIQGMHMKVFSKVYCDRVYFLRAERFETGSGFQPPQRHRASKLSNNSFTNLYFYPFKKVHELVK